MELGVGTIVYEFGGIPLSEAVDRLHNHGVKVCRHTCLRGLQSHAASCRNATGDW